MGPLLPDLDSNQDKQSQSLSYYRYTIRQFADKELISFIFGCKDNLETTEQGKRIPSNN